MKLTHKLLKLLTILLSLPFSFIIGWNLAKYVPPQGKLTLAVKEAIVLATTKKPETFTELYFEDHINLPNKIEIGKVQSFSFTIHNLEYQDMTYKYEIKAIDDRGEQSLSTASVTLPHDEYITIDESYVIATNSGRVRIQATLVDKSQLIAYWMEKI